MELEFAIRQTHVHELNKNDMKLELASYHESTNPGAYTSQIVYVEAQTYIFQIRCVELQSSFVDDVFRGTKAWWMEKITLMWPCGDMYQALYKWC